MAATCRYNIALLLALISTAAVLLPQEGDATAVVFILCKTVAFGQGFVIAGNTSSLGNWVPTDAPLMTFTESCWVLTVELDAGLYVEFKPVRVVYDTKEPLEWYHGSNLNITVPADPTTVIIDWNGSTSLSTGPSIATL